MTERIVALDIGDKRIGVAFSDPFGEYAVPGDTYFRTGDLERDVAAMQALAERENASAVVCGLPLNADGTESVQTRKTARFISALRERLFIPVYEEDERYTTREARRDLVFTGVSSKKDKKNKHIDSLAAAYILEGFLSRRKKEKTAMSFKEENNDYEDGDNIVELIDEDGNTLRYEHVGTIEYKGEWYSRARKSPSSAWWATRTTSASRPSTTTRSSTRCSRNSATSTKTLRTPTKRRCSSPTRTKAVGNSAGKREAR